MSSAQNQSEPIQIAGLRPTTSTSTNYVLLLLGCGLLFGGVGAAIVAHEPQIARYCFAVGSLLGGIAVIVAIGFVRIPPPPLFEIDLQRGILRTRRYRWMPIGFKASLFQIGTVAQFEVHASEITRFNVAQDRSGRWNCDVLHVDTFTKTLQISGRPDDPAIARAHETLQSLMASSAGTLGQQSVKANAPRPRGGLTILLAVVTIWIVFYSMALWFADPILRFLHIHLGP